LAIAAVDKYYLTVDGLDGGVTGAHHAGAFAVANFRFDISVGLSGQPTPVPLVIDLEPGAPVTPLIERMVRKQSLGLVRLEGVTSEEKGAHTVYDLRLLPAYLAKVTDTAGHDHLQLTYSQVSLTTRAQVSASGALGARPPPGHCPLPTRAIRAAPRISVRATT
jgi:hypothetical protein